MPYAPLKHLTKSMMRGDTIKHSNLRHALKKKKDFVRFIDIQYVVFMCVFFVFYCCFCNIQVLSESIDFISAIWWLDSYWSRKMFGSIYW